MTDRWGKTLTGLAALAALWILVYWWWQPRGVTISYDDSSAARPIPAAQTTPTIQPILPPAQTIPTPAIQPPPSDTRAVIPPRFRDYTIKPGDTLKDIARRELGSERHWEAIARANPLKDIERLRQGRTIRIPLDPTNIQGIPNPSAPIAAAPTQPQGQPQIQPQIQPQVQPQAQTPPQPAPQPNTAQPPAPRTYTVRPGDTLTDIAQRELGSKNAVNDIIKLNNLTNPDALRVGQKLQLPPR